MRPLSLAACGRDRASRGKLGWIDVLDLGDLALGMLADLALEKVIAHATDPRVLLKFGFQHVRGFWCRFFSLYRSPPCRAFTQSDPAVRPTRRLSRRIPWPLSVLPMSRYELPAASDRFPMRADIPPAGALLHPIASDPNVPVPIPAPVTWGPGVKRTRWWNGLDYRGWRR